MAYWCLTRVEDSIGDPPQGRRKRATSKYCIDVQVLNRLGDLVSEKGGDDARKARGASTPYSDAERSWIDATVKALICRLGEVANAPGGVHQKITMADLPNLP